MAALVLVTASCSKVDNKAEADNQGLPPNTLRVFFEVKSFPFDTPKTVSVYGTWGYTRELAYVEFVGWQTVDTKMKNYVAATASDKFGFSIDNGTKVLMEEVNGEWQPVEITLGDVWVNFPPYPKMKAVFLDKEWMEGKNYDWKEKQ